MVSSVNVGGASTALLAPDRARLGFWVVNPLGSPGTLYVRLGAGVATTTPGGYSFFLAPGERYESQIPGFGGAVSAIIDVPGPVAVPVSDLRAS